MNQKGLSLIELLIASLILVFILAFIAQGWRSTSQGTSLVANKSALLEDARSAGQTISDFAQGAVYVYPPGVTLTLNTGAMAGNYRVTNPATGGNQWTVGDDNIVAFIEDRKNNDPKFACKPTGKPEEADSCLVFVAYYVLDRANVVKVATGKENPGEDPFNGQNGMLYEYRLQLDLDELSDTVSGPMDPEKTGPPPTTIGTGTNFGAPTPVADNIAPNLTGKGPKYAFMLKSQSCRDNEGSYVDGSGKALERMMGSTEYDTSKFDPGCPTSLQPNQQDPKGSGELAAKASISQASLVLETKRENNMGQKFSSGPLIFPITPKNLLN